MGIKKVFGSWRCFGGNPALATKILVNIVGMAVMRPFSPAYMRYERDLEEVRKSRCPEEQLQGVTIGALVFVSLVFTVAYSIISLTYWVLWV